MVIGLMEEESSMVAKNSNIAKKNNEVGISTSNEQGEE